MCVKSVACRLELTYYMNGGILHYVLRSLISSLQDAPLTRSCTGLPRYTEGGVLQQSAPMPETCIACFGLHKLVQSTFFQILLYTTLYVLFAY